MKIELKNVYVAILFAILFIMLGWIAPAMYASHAPQEHFIEVHEFSADNATIEDRQHQLCFDRTVYKPNSATIVTELYLIGGDNELYEIESKVSEEYFEKGNYSVKIPYDLPESLEAGSYRYVLDINMDLANGRVERDFAFESETFHIKQTGSNMSAEFGCPS